MTETFRYTSPEPPRAATGVIADVYAQLATDFGIDRATTFVVLSASPPLLAGTWAVMRESLLAGQGITHPQGGGGGGVVSCCRFTELK
ncbi:hypothetical protein ACWFRK_10840 [Streptomyces sp. NPDC055157]